MVENHQMVAAKHIYLRRPIYPNLSYLFGIGMMAIHIKTHKKNS